MPARNTKCGGVSGDRISTTVQYYYPTYTSTTGDGLNTLLAGLASLLVNSAGSSSLVKANASTLSTNVGTDPNAQSFFTQQNTTAVSTKPMVFLNVLFFNSLSRTFGREAI
jgi:hypothetical protein